MSTSAILRRCYGRLGLLHLHPDVERLVVQALAAAAPGPGRILLDAAREARLDHESLLGRSSAAFLNFAAFNLSDDLSDGDCTYVPPAEAPAVLLILDNLFFSSLRDLALPPRVEQRVLSDLVAAEEAQVLETGTTAWDADRLTLVTDGIAGSQWSAYLTLVWAGTRLEPYAGDIARGLGRVALLAGDIVSNDSRFTSLPAEDRVAVIDQALASARDLDAAGLAFTAAPLAASRTVIAEQLASLS